MRRGAAIGQEVCFRRWRKLWQRNVGLPHGSKLYRSVGSASHVSSRGCQHRVSAGRSGDRLPSPRDESQGSRVPVEKQSEAGCRRRRCRRTQGTSHVGGDGRLHACRNSHVFTLAGALRRSIPRRIHAATRQWRERKSLRQEKHAAGNSESWRVERSEPDRRVAESVSEKRIGSRLAKKIAPKSTTFV